MGRFADPGVGNGAVGRFGLEHDEAAQLGDGAAGDLDAPGRERRRVEAAARVRPAQLFDEDLLELEALEPLLHVAKINAHWIPMLQTMLGSRA